MFELWHVEGYLGPEQNPNLYNLYTLRLYILVFDSHIAQFSLVLRFLIDLIFWALNNDKISQ